MRGLCLLFAVLLWVTPKCFALAASSDPVQQRSLVIWFQEREAETALYSVRMIVNAQFLRIDDGEDRGDFVLLNRAAQTIYSVDHDNQSILVITAGTVALDQNKELHQTVEKLQDDASPDIAGRPVTVYRLYTNNQLCFEVAAAEGLLDDAVQSLREFHRILAAEQAGLVEQMPAELRSDCDLSATVFFPDRYLQFGFPVRQRGYDGKERALQDFQTEFMADPVLFEVPLHYRQFRTGDVKG